LEITTVSELTLVAAETIAKAALEYARRERLAPLGVAVLDARGALKCYLAEENVSLSRADIAIGKASGALAMGVGSRSLAKRARDVPHFIYAVAPMVSRGLVPVPGGVLVRNTEGELLGAVGVSGDTSDNDESAALAGVEAAKLVADPGSD
jgi:uncharacterized protein GlcG (DUF336 family)